MRTAACAPTALLGACSAAAACLLVLVLLVCSACCTPSSPPACCCSLPADLSEPPDAPGTLPIREAGDRERRPTHVGLSGAGELPSAASRF